MKRFILTASVLSIFLLTVSAQNEEDALRYSNLKQLGTARYAGVNGAFGAVGADFSTLSSNPAGIAFYKRSEVTLSPSFYFGNTEGYYNGQTMEDGRNNFALGNAGIILAMKPIDRLDRSELKNYHFGFGVNRMADFNGRTIYQGVNTENSMLDAYLEFANKEDPNGFNPRENLDPFDTYPAYDTDLLEYIVDTINGQSKWVHAYFYDDTSGLFPPTNAFSSALQRKSIEEKGSINEMVFSGGVNISDRFYFGFTLGFPFIRYYRSSTYTEFNQNVEKDLEQFTYYEKLETHGSGFNIKVGTIVRATDWLRVGVAYHTPTWYSEINDRYYTSMKSNFKYYIDGKNSYNVSSPNGEFNYDIKTPGRFIGSAAIIIGKMGLISADYEYLDYSNARLSPTADFTDPNDVIKQNFSNTQNIRIGTEWNVGPVQLRAGYSNYGSPFKSGVNDGQRNSFSGGLGFRNESFFYDFALVYSKYEIDNYLYVTDDPDYTPNPATITSSSYNFLITLGYRFD